MNYELAKKLKDAGFPQTDDEQRTANHPDGVSDWAYCPTLEELIEACGNTFDALIFNADGRWTCSGSGSIVEGDTPEEAVANLYLKLHE